MGEVLRTWARSGSARAGRGSAFRSNIRLKKGRGRAQETVGSASAREEDVGG